MKFLLVVLLSIALTASLKHNRQSTNKLKGTTFAFN